MSRIVAVALPATGHAIAILAAGWMFGWFFAAITYRLGIGLPGL